MPVIELCCNEVASYLFGWIEFYSECVGQREKASSILKQLLYFLNKGPRYSCAIYEIKIPWGNTNQQDSLNSKRM